MKNNILIILVVVLGLFSCSNDDTPPETPTLLYDIRGSVNLYDEGVTAVSKSGMIVYLEGNEPRMSTMTDEQVDFTFSVIEKGTYSLAFEKEGYGTFKKFEIEHNKDETTFITDNPSLGEKTTTRVTNLVATVVNDTLNLSTTIEPDANNSNPRYVRVFFGINNDLSPEKYDYYSEPHVIRINPFSLKYSSADLMSFGFEKGESVYVSIAGESYFSNSYFDPGMELQIFPNLYWTAGGDSFIVP